MNYRNNYCFLDFETTSKNANKCQPTSLSAVMFSARKLELMPNGIFNSFIKPELDDEKAIAAGLAPVTDEVLNKTHMTREQLAAAPTQDVVWTNFLQWLEQFSNSSTNQWDKPIFCGYNNTKYDATIINRLAKKYGQWDDEYQEAKVFHPVIIYDLMVEVHKYTENMKINSNNSISMDSIRKWLNIDDKLSHMSLKDVLDGGFLMRKFINFTRYASKDLIDWENCFENENKEIALLLEKYK